MSQRKNSHPEGGLHKSLDLEQTAKLLANTPVLALMAKQDGEILYANACFERYVGFKLADIKGKNWFDRFLLDDDREKGRALLKKTFRGEHTSPITNTIATCKGEIRTIEWSDMTLGTLQGGTKAILVTGTDVSDKQKEINEIQVDHGRLVEGQRISKIGYWDLDLQSGVLNWSDQVFALFEIDPDFFPASYDAFLAAIHPDDIQAVNEAYTNSLETHLPYRITHRLKMPDGRIKWVEERCETVFDGEGTALISKGTVQDITDTITAKQEKLQAEDTLASILSNSHEAIIVTDDDLNIEVFNDGAEKIFGYSQDETLGKNLEIFFPERHLNIHRQNVIDYKENPENSNILDNSIEFYGLRKNGEEFPAEISVSTVSTHTGDIFSILIRDNSLLKARETSLKAERERANAANTAKSRFLATMSHEIRTPLHGILGVNQLLGRTQLTQAQQQYLDSIESSGDTLLSLIDNLLDFSRIESGLFELHPNRINVQSLLQEVLGTFQIPAAEKGVFLNAEITPGTFSVIGADPLRLRQILTNLVGNALKFTTKGSVSVKVTTSNDSHIFFSVKDTGIGISEKDRKKVFERFAQSDDSIQRRFGGTGLGLSIVKELVTLMDGQIGVKSELGQGSEFWFTLPVCQEGYQLDPDILQQTPDATLVQDDIGSGKTAMVVDDEQANRLVCSSLLKELGFNIIEFDSGNKALRALEKSRVDIVFMDLHMPELSGDECIRKIRSQRAGYSDIPIAIMTADVSTSASEIATEVGANQFCTKPFSLEQLANISEDLLSLNKPGKTIKEPLHLVLIDDDPLEHELLGRLIEDIDQKITLDHFMSTQEFCEQGVFTKESIILLDGQMPPISKHEESLHILAERGCDAKICLLSSDRYTTRPHIEGINIIDVVDKLDIQSSRYLNGFIDKIINRR